jgi:hypothetical protein
MGIYVWNELVILFLEQVYLLKESKETINRFVAPDDVTMLIRFNSHPVVARRIAIHA